MTKILDIYKKYKIMPSLAMHQFRVAGVAMHICEALPSGSVVDKDKIIKACLLHDMGNIIKFKLDHFPEFIESEGLEYWQKIQNDFREKYGMDEHEATLHILKELCVDDDTFQCVSAVDFNNWLEVLKSGDLEKQICVYADTRVGPHGVLSIEDRFIEGEIRYKTKDPWFEDVRKTLKNHAKNIEINVFKNCKINPEDISDESIIQYIEKLQNIEI